MSLREADLVDRPQRAVHCREHESMGTLKLGDLVLQWHALTKECDRDFEPAAESFRDLRQALRRDDARIPFGGATEIGQVVEGFFDWYGEINCVYESGHSSVLRLDVGDPLSHTDTVKEISLQKIELRRFAQAEDL